MRQPMELTVETTTAAPATIVDVAALAGVGIGTVSRVLNDSPQVRPATRARVLEAMSELNYVRLRTAARLPEEPTRYVGVVVLHFDEPSVYQRLKGMVTALGLGGYRPVVHNVSRPDEARSMLTELQRSRHLDGAVVISLPLGNDEGERLAEARFPIVLVDTRHPSMTSVEIDDVAGGEMATRHLISLGHKRIAYVGEPPRNPFQFVASKRREDGYRLAMANAGLRVPTNYVKHGIHLRSASRQLAMELFALAEPPTAVVSFSDIHALGVLEAAEATGRDVPGDLSVMGYDDIELAAYTGLSTVRQPLEVSGERAAQILLDAIASDIRPQPYVERLPLEIVVRSTTSAPNTTR